MSSEDTSEFNVFVESKPGITMEAMQVEMDKIYEEIIKDKTIDIASVQIGYNTLQNPFRAKVYVKLVEQKERKGRDQFAIMADLRKNLREKFGQFTISASEISTMGGGPNAPLQVIIKGDNQDKVPNLPTNLSQCFAMSKESPMCAQIRQTFRLNIA